MGWTFYNSRGRDVVEILKTDVVGDYHRWIDHEMVGTTVYAVLERNPERDTWGPNRTYVPDPDGKYRFIAVFLTTGSGRSFGYKDMTESMGPYNYECPRRLIEQASPLQDGPASAWAREWRERCLKGA